MFEAGPGSVCPGGYERGRVLGPPHRADGETGARRGRGEVGRPPRGRVPRDGLVHPQQAPQRQRNTAASQVRGRNASILCR